MQGAKRGRVAVFALIAGVGVGVLVGRLSVRDSRSGTGASSGGVEASVNDSDGAQARRRMRAPGGGAQAAAGGEGAAIGERSTAGQPSATDAPAESDVDAGGGQDETETGSDAGAYPEFADWSEARLREELELAAETRMSDANVAQRAGTMLYTLFSRGPDVRISLELTTSLLDAAGPFHRYMGMNRALYRFTEEEFETMYARGSAVTDDSPVSDWALLPYVVQGVGNYQDLEWDEERVRSLLRHPDRTVRWAALLSMRSAPLAGMRDTVFAIARSDPDLRLRGDALEILARDGGLPATDLVELALVVSEDPDVMIRHSLSDVEVTNVTDKQARRALRLLVGDGFAYDEGSELLLKVVVRGGLLGQLLDAQPPEQCFESLARELPEMLSSDEALLDRIDAHMSRVAAELADHVRQGFFDDLGRVAGPAWLGRRALDGSGSVKDRAQAVRAMSRCAGRGSRLPDEVLRVARQIAWGEGAPFELRRAAIDVLWSDPSQREREVDAQLRALEASTTPAAVRRFLLAAFRERSTGSHWGRRARGTRPCSPCCAPSSPRTRRTGCRPRRS